jgi:hypothetical protein
VPFSTREVRSLHADIRSIRTYGRKAADEGSESRIFSYVFVTWMRDRVCPESRLYGQVGRFPMSVSELAIMRLLDFAPGLEFHIST